jgi:DNA-directed RNA polymerase specialized sigma24 family protein
LKTVIDEDADQPGHVELDEGLDDVSARFADLWRGGATDATIYTFLAIEVAPRINSHLKRSTELQEADREDCISVAFERFAPAISSRASVFNPYAYVFTTAVNEARKLVRARKREWVGEHADVAALADDSSCDPAAAVSEPVDPAGRLALAVVEDSAPDLEVEEFWAVEVVQVAVSRLPAGARRLIELLQYKDFALDGPQAGDFDYQSGDAAADLGLAKAAFRTAKHRAYSRLRDEIPKVIVEMGLRPPERADAVLFPDRHTAAED